MDRRASGIGRSATGDWQSFCAAFDGPSQEAKSLG
jgi:hypothetical protein